MATSINHPPVLPIRECETWSRQLERIASEPLEFCEELPTIAQRFEAWWVQEVIDRPIFMASVNTSPARPITRRLELLEDGRFAAAVSASDVCTLACRRRAEDGHTHRIGFPPVTAIVAPET